MSEINAIWHSRNPLPRAATLALRVAWHIKHAKACGCRAIPATVVEALRRQGRRIPARRRGRLPARRA